MQIKRVLIAGSREFSDISLFSTYLNKYLAEHTLTDYSKIKLVSGGARGVDTLAENFAKVNNIEIQIFKPDWSVGKFAGIVRNKEMSENCDIALIFWDGKSKGTENMISLLNKKNIPTQIKYISTDGER